MSTSVSGTVVSSSSSSLVIKTDSGSRMTFQVDTSSNLPVGIAAGDRVSLDYESLAGGKYHVSRVSSESTTMPSGSERYGKTETPSTETSGAAGEKPEKLPRTASPLPLIALIGSLSVGAAVGIRLFSRAGS